ncbi:hypothetical protein Q8A73_020083 [Channa argus]|nr:hypothetical protein Q8A73_020083 [Channa argus]
MEELKLTLRIREVEVRNWELEVEAMLLKVKALEIERGAAVPASPGPLSPSSGREDGFDMSKKNTFHELCCEEMFFLVKPMPFRAVEMGDLAGAPAPLQDLPLTPGMTMEELKLTLQIREVEVRNWELEMEAMLLKVKALEIERGAAVLASPGPLSPSSGREDGFDVTPASVPVAALRSATARLVPVPVPATRSATICPVSVCSVSVYQGPAAVPVLLSVSAVASPAPDSGPAPRLVSAPPGPESDPALAPSSGSLDALSGLDSDPDPAPASWSLTTSPSLDPSSVPVPGSGSAVVRPCSVPAPGSWLQVCCGLVSTLVLFLLLAPGRPWSGSVPAPGSGSVVVRPGSFPVPCSGLAVVGPGSVPAPGSWLWVCCGLASTLVLFLLLAPVRLRSGPFLNLLQAPGRLTLLLVHLLVLHYRDPV